MGTASAGECVAPGNRKQEPHDFRFPNHINTDTKTMKKNRRKKGFETRIVRLRLDQIQKNRVLYEEGLSPLLTDSARRLNPNDAEACLFRGFVYEAKGEYDLAIADYSRAIWFDSKYPQAYYRRGITYDLQGDYDKAILDFTQAIHLNPHYADAYNDRGVAYMKKGEAIKGIADFTEGIRLDPNYAGAYCDRGNAYTATGEYGRAVADASEAIRLDPQSVNAYCIRGVAYGYRGEYTAYAWMY